MLLMNPVQASFLWIERTVSVNADDPKDLHLFMVREIAIILDRMNSSSLVHWRRDNSINCETRCKLIK